MSDIIFRKQGEITVGERTQAQGGGRSHGMIDIEGLRVTIEEGVLTIQGLRKRGPIVRPLAGNVIEIPTEDPNVLALLIQQLELAGNPVRAVAKAPRRRRRRQSAA